MEITSVYSYFLTSVSFFALLVVWPRTIFAFYLRGKKLTFQFFASIGIGTILLTFLCGLLALTHLLQEYVLPVIIFVSFGIFFVINTIYWILKFGKTKKLEIPFLSTILNLFKSVKTKIKNKQFSTFDVISFFCNIAIVIIICIIVGYFASYIINDPNNVSADMWRHEYFIYQMFVGDFFNGGLYPFGMHSIIYAMAYTFYVPVQAIMWNLNFVAAILFMVSLFVLFKKIFKLRASVLFALLLFFVLCVTASTKTMQLAMLWEGLHRICWTLPEELVLWTVFISPILVMEILKSDRPIKDKANFNNLVLLSIMIGTSLCVHYYTTAIQFVFCASVALLYIKGFTIKKFFALAISSLGGAVSAGISLLLAFIRVGSWSFSLYWAAYIQYANYGNDESLVFAQPSNYSSALAQHASTPLDVFTSKLYAFFNDGFMPLFGLNFSIPLMLLFLFGLGVLIYRIFQKGFDSKMYLSLLLVFVILFVLYSSDILGIPRTIEGYRLVLPLYICLVCISTLPFELIIQNIIKPKQ